MPTMLFASRLALRAASQNLARVGVALLLLLPAACETPSPVESYPDITFAHLAPLRFAVSDIRIDPQFSAPTAAPHAEYLAPVQPLRAMEGWAKDRLAAAGTNGEITFRILDASIVEAPLTTEQGFKGFFKKEQARRYELSLKSEIEARDSSGRARAIADVEVKGSQTVPEGASLRERDGVLFTLVERAMKTFDAEMERQIRAHLAEFLL